MARLLQCTVYLFKTFKNHYMKLNIFKFLAIIFIIALFSEISYSYPGGVAGKTLKSTTAGCGSCHAFGTALTGTITGPDTVNAGQTAVFSITLNRSGSWKGSLDIAAQFGTLAIGGGSAYLKLLSNELVHKASINFSNSITIQFSYTAPAAPGFDTLYATIDVNYSGIWNWTPNKKLVIKSPSGITDPSIPVNYDLKQNFPNPFNPVTKINYSLPKSSEVKLTVYDLLGNKVNELVNTAQQSGNYTVEFKGNGLSSGVYFYKLEAGNFTDIKRMTLIK